MDGSVRQSYAPEPHGGYSAPRSDLSVAVGRASHHGNIGHGELWTADRDRRIATGFIELHASKRINVQRRFDLRHLYRHG